MTDDFGRPYLNEVSFQVSAGEIVGIAGIQGNGQTELVEVITGMMSLAEGTISFEGADISHLSPRKRHAAGMAHVPEDRNESGMVGSFTVAENLILDSYYTEPFSKGGRLQRADIATSAIGLVEAYDVRPPHIENTGSALSGGNAQKMIVAREFSRDVPLLVCSQPTRGIDVGSIEYIHEQIIRKRQEGKAILIVSTELDEIFALSDRILVLFDGKVVAERKPAETTPAEIGLFMAGKTT